MSHFRVAVIQTPRSKTLDEMMDPYYEELDVEPYVAMTYEEAINDARKIIERAKSYIDKTTANVKQHQNDWGKGIVDATAELSTDDELFEWYVNDYNKDVYTVDENKNLLSTYNKQAKYDYYSEWYTESFNDWIDRKDDDDDEPLSNKELEDIWNRISTKGDGWYKPEYFIRRYGDLETYSRWRKLPIGYAVMTPNGEWHAPGTVGWFATDDASTESIREYLDWFDKLKDAYYDRPNVTVTIIDCHI